jgi:hypothetical protein
MSSLQQSIITTCLETFDTDMPTIYSGGRAPQVCECRSAMGYWLRALIGMSYPECAKIMGRETHTTVYSAVKRYKNIDEGKRRMLELEMNRLFRPLNWKHGMHHDRESLSEAYANVRREAIRDVTETLHGIGMPKAARAVAKHYQETSNQVRALGKESRDTTWSDMGDYNRKLRGLKKSA